MPTGRKWGHKSILLNWDPKSIRFSLLFDVASSWHYPFQYWNAVLDVVFHLQDNGSRKSFFFFNLWPGLERMFLRWVSLVLVYSISISFLGRHCELSSCAFFFNFSLYLSGLFIRRTYLPIAVSNTSHGPGSSLNCKLNKPSSSLISLQPKAKLGPIQLLSCHFKWA